MLSFSHKSEKHQPGEPLTASLADVKIAGQGICKVYKTGKSNRFSDHHFLNRA